VVALIASMVMWDINAVDICMGAHERILEDTGVAFQPESQVRGRAPFPRARHVEAVVVDDRVSLTAVPSGTRRLPAVAERSFREGGKRFARRASACTPTRECVTPSTRPRLALRLTAFAALPARSACDGTSSLTSLWRWVAKVAGRQRRGGS